MKLALLQFEIEVVFSQLLQDLLHVVAMIGQVLGVNEDVIDVHYDEALEVLPEQLIHKSLEG